jgi:hypothetical protein
MREINHSNLCSVSPDRYACVKGDNTTKRGASQRGRAATRWSDTGTTSAHNANAFAFAPLLALRHCQGDTSSPFSSPFVVGPLVFANRAGLSLFSLFFLFFIKGFSKAQSSKLEGLFCHVSVKRDFRALSFERTIENFTAW